MQRRCEQTGDDGTATTRVAGRRARRARRARLALGMVLGLASVCAPAWANDKPLQDDALLAGAERFEQGAKHITEVNLDKTMLQMAAGFLKGEKDDEGLALAKKMDFVYVRSFEYASAGQYKLADVESFRARLDATKWSHMVKERSATETTDIWVKTDADGQFSELLVIAAEPTELTFVHLKGHMSMEELSRAGASYGVTQDHAKQKARSK